MIEFWHRKRVLSIASAQATREFLCRALFRLDHAKLDVADIQLKGSFGSAKKALRRIGQGHIKSSRMLGRCGQPLLLSRSLTARAQFSAESTR